MHPRGEELARQDEYLVSISRSLGVIGDTASAINQALADQKGLLVDLERPIDKLSGDMKSITRRVVQKNKDDAWTYRRTTGIIACLVAVIVVLVFLIVYT
jgi:hypothetical protein